MKIDSNLIDNDNNKNQEKESEKRINNKHLLTSLSKNENFEFENKDNKVINDKEVSLFHQYFNSTKRRTRNYINNVKYEIISYKKPYIMKYLKNTKANPELYNIDSIIKKKNFSYRETEYRNDKKGKSLIEFQKNDIFNKRQNKEINKFNTIKDIWKPKNYENYEYLIKNPLSFRLKTENDYSMKNIPYIGYNEIKNKMNYTDIFFSKPKSPNGIYFKPEKNYSNLYTESDIFNMKKDIVNLSKCGENYLFQLENKKKYTPSNESKSHWQPKINFPNLINFSSTEYNITYPKNINPFRTKRKIMSECEQKIKTDKIIFQPTHKQKGVSEFIDITRNGASNPGKEFMKLYKENPQIFQRNSDIGAKLLDNSLNYKPFSKWNVI